MDVNDVIVIEEEPIKVEEVTTNTVYGHEPPFHKGGRNVLRPPSSRHNKKVQFALLRVAAKLKEVEELEKKLLNQVNNGTSNFNIDKPTFSSTQLIHPLNFIENLTSFLDKIPEHNRTIETVMDCLQGDALNWATILKPRWSKFDDFVKSFLEQYWGREEQSLLKKQIINGRWNFKGETMCRHFICLISQAKWLTNKMADDELIFEIMHHFPKHVQVAWYVSNKSTVLEATEFLKKMDEIEVMCQGKKRIRQRYYMQKKYMVDCNNGSSGNVRQENENEPPNGKKFKPEEL